MKMILELKRFSSDGKLLEKRRQESRSWLKHFFDLLFPLCTKTDFAGVNDIAGVAHTLKSANWSINTNLMVGSPPGNVQTVIRSYTTNPNGYAGDFLGIQVGIGVLDPTPIQNALVTRVVHGETAGTLLYGGCELYGLTFANPNGQFTIRRYFTNVLGGNIAIAEVGIYSPGTKSVASVPAYIFCITRDRVNPAITVANGEILEVTYTPQITV